jgi:hypothetical protein
VTPAPERFGALSFSRQLFGRLLDFNFLIVCPCSRSQGQLGGAVRAVCGLEARAIPGDVSFGEREEWEVSPPPLHQAWHPFFPLTLTLPSDILLRVNSFIYSNDSAPHPAAPEIAANPFKFTLLRKGAI